MDTKLFGRSREEHESNLTNDQLYSIDVSWRFDIQLRQQPVLTGGPYKEPYVATVARRKDDEKYEAVW